MPKKNKINKDNKSFSNQRNKKEENKYDTFPVGEELIGVIDIARSGDAFVIVEGKKKDFFVFRKNINKAY